MSIFADLTFARRTMLKHWPVTIAAVVTLALGIGANTTVFSVVKAILVDPFVFHDQNNTVLIFSENATQHKIKQDVSVADFRDWRERARSFDQMSIVVPTIVALTGLKEPMRVTAARVSADFFPFFDLKPTMGRTFTADEFRAGDGRSIVISNSFWKSQFASDRATVGKNVSIDGEPYTIVGVMPPSFWVPSRQTSVWLPITPPVTKPEIRTERDGLVLAHIRSGATLEQANQELAAVSKQLVATYPLANGGWAARAYKPLQAVMGPNDPVILGLLFGVVGALLLVACSNVANLLLAQGAARRREMAIRTAVGATRWRITRQSLTESFLLALIAGAFGLLIGFWAKDFFINIYPSQILISDRLMDTAVLGFSLLVSALAALIFGVAPALDSSSGDPIEALKESRGRSARSRRLADSFVASQIALSTVLLIVTGLLLENVRHLRSLDLGFQPRGLAVVKVQPSQLRHRGDEQLQKFYRASMEGVANVGGVRTVAATSCVPLFTEGAPVHVAMPGEQTPPAERPVALRTVVTTKYFDAAGIRLHRGREFGPEDQPTATRVAVVNQAFAERFFKDADSIGKQVRLMDADARGDLWTIVGIAANVRPPDIQGAAHPQIYVPFTQAPAREMTLLVRTDGDPSRILAGLRRAIATVDPDEPVEAVTMGQMLQDQLRQFTILFDMLGIFAALALAMASVGLFALVAYAVNERTREIGIRIALGATRSGVVGLVVRRGMRLAIYGLGIGLLLGALVARSLGGLLIEFSPWDPITFSVVIVLLTAVAALASYLPARRATQIDPSTALRQD